MSFTDEMTRSTDELPSGTAGRLLCAVAAGATLVPFALCSFGGNSGAEITRSLQQNAGSLQIGSGIAVVVAALLVVAAVRVAGSVRGTAGPVMLGSGVATAVLYAAYYAAFGAGAVVADLAVAEPGPGVGEGTALLVNFAELTRYAPGLVLVGAAVVARAALPRLVWVSAALLTVLTLFPLTSWVAALLIPVWLGVAGATRREAQKSRSVGSSSPRRAL